MPTGGAWASKHMVTPPEHKELKELMHFNLAHYISSLIISSEQL
jgi:hypothetical protein